METSVSSAGLLRLAGTVKVRAGKRGAAWIEIRADVRRARTARYRPIGSVRSDR